MNGSSYAGMSTIPSDQAQNVVNAFHSILGGGISFVYQPNPTAQEADEGITPAERTITIPKDQAAKVASAASCACGIPNRAIGLSFHIEDYICDKGGKKAGSPITICVTPERRGSLFKELEKAVCQTNPTNPTPHG